MSSTLEGGSGGDALLNQPLPDNWHLLIKTQRLREYDLYALVPPSPRAGERRADLIKALMSVHVAGAPVKIPSTRMPRSARLGAAAAAVAATCPSTPTVNSSEPSVRSPRSGLAPAAPTSEALDALDGPPERSSTALPGSAARMSLDIPGIEELYYPNSCDIARGPPPRCSTAGVAPRPFLPVSGAARASTQDLAAAAAPTSPPAPQTPSPLPLQLPSLPLQLPSPPPPPPPPPKPVAVNSAAAAAAAAGEQLNVRYSAGPIDVPICARRHRRASVDAAAGAELLLTRMASAASNWDQAAQEATLEFCGAETLASRPCSPPPEWRFDDNLQYARMQARYAAASATDEITYAALEGSGGGRRGDGGRRRSRSSGGGGAGGVGGGNRAGRRSGFGFWERLRAASLRVFLGMGKGGRGGDRRVPARVEFTNPEEEDEPMPVQRARDSRIVHRTRLGLDGRPTHGAKRGILAARQGGGGGDEDPYTADMGDETEAAITAAALAFTAAASAPSATGAGAFAFAKALSGTAKGRVAAPPASGGRQQVCITLPGAGKVCFRVPNFRPVSPSSSPAEALPSVTAAASATVARSGGSLFGRPRSRIKVPPIEGPIPQPPAAPPGPTEGIGAPAPPPPPAAQQPADATSTPAPAAADVPSPGKAGGEAQDRVKVWAVPESEAESDFTPIERLRTQLLMTSALAPDTNVQGSPPLPHSAELYLIPEPQAPPKVVVAATATAATAAPPSPVQEGDSTGKRDAVVAVAVAQGGGAIGASRALPPVTAGTRVAPSRQPVSRGRLFRIRGMWPPAWGSL